LLDTNHEPDAALLAPDIRLMETLDTRDRIKEAAMRLFAERGVEAVTVREIVAASGARNGGSLNYYFKSKEGLITELLADVFRVSSADWLDGLSKLDKNGGPTCTRDIIRIIVYAPGPHFRQSRSPTATRFLASVLFTRRKMVSELLEQANFSVFSRLLAQISALNPHLPRSIMQQRLIYLSWYLVSALSAHEASLAEGRKRSRVWTDVDALANLVDAAVGLIEAPVSDCAPPGATPV
jgi:AcrR family transcriptional regulator